MARLNIGIRPSWVARPFHLAFTRPFTDIDRTEWAARWGTTEIPVATGPHEIAVHFRYRGQKSARPGIGRAEFVVDGSSGPLALRAVLDVRNGSPCKVTVA
ncbi:hypothetical protein OHB41_40680 [Streptomyces sp. NBC_01571]|uniref:hypothetical protein n=1 Tax=Streptomyces sp. NBC_01571 TaxID=2975883 RepID=UPI00225A2CCD|nr:hypothetical protein [Streptomyces sp. NBC_01571]MCX4579390.1 hypothetical protein [Streptomyces sp. NBC_01571]